MVNEKAIIGCILGTAVGDALGLPYEGMSPSRARKLLGPLERYRFVFGRGIISDDTEHTCMVSQSLIESGDNVEAFTMQFASRLRGFSSARPTVFLKIRDSPMKIMIKVGDVLNTPADVLISTANPWLNLSGGVNGAILESIGPDLQTELHKYLKKQGVSAVLAGTVVRSNAYTLPFTHILHAVAIDPFYDSSEVLVRATFEKALDMSLELDALTVSSPTLATGYGPMSISGFGAAIAPVLKKSSLKSLTLNLVVRREDHAIELQEALFKAGVMVTE